MPSGSTRISAMFCTSRTSWMPWRTSSNGLYAADFGLVGLKYKQCEKCARQPAVSVQFSPLMSCTTHDPRHVSTVGTTRPTPLPDRVGEIAMRCRSEDRRVGKGGGRTGGYRG